MTTPGLTPIEENARWTALTEQISLIVNPHDRDRAGDALMEAYLLGVEVGTKRAQAPAATPPAVLSWDWRGALDTVALRAALRPMGVHVHSVDTDSDHYAIVLAPTALTTEQVREAYRIYWERS